MNAEPADWSVMRTASRHAKPKTTSTPRLRALAVAATALAGVVAAFVFLQGGSAAPMSAHDASQMTSARSASADFNTITAVHRIIAARTARQASLAAHRKHLAALRLARQRAAARRQAAQSPSPSPSSAPPPSGGGDAAHSALGICIRNAEEGGSYAWGPGNGGGAYQFLLSTWETYGGAASEYGVAGPAYQDQIFDNAIAAGGASNWTNYDGC
jgi:hypothetical protein